MPRLIRHFDRIQANIQELVDRFQGTRDGQVILEFDRDTQLLEDATRREAVSQGKR